MKGEKINQMERTERGKGRENVIAIWKYERKVTTL